MASRHILKFATLMAVFVVGSASTGTSAAPRDARLADAAEQRQLGLVDELLNSGADVNATQVDGMTALHWASYHDVAGSVWCGREREESLRSHADFSRCDKS